MQSRIPQTAGSTASSLLRRAQLRDPEAWTRISELYVPLVYRWARQAGLQESDTADVAQEVFRTVALRLGQLRRDRPGDSFRGWLWGVTRNKLKEFFRWRAESAQAIGGTDAHARLHALPDQPPEDSQQVERLGTQAALMHRAMQWIRPEFTDKTWQAFWRTAIDQQKTADVAEELEMTGKADRQAKYWVMRRLRAEIDKLL